MIFSPFCELSNILDMTLYFNLKTAMHKQKDISLFEEDESSGII